MEDWSYPPSFDEAYRPPMDSAYWFPERETMPAAEREARILERLKEVCAYAYARAPFYRRKWDEAGFHPDALRTLEDFEEKVPVVTKADLRASQAAHPPFGDYLCTNERDVFHVHGTSGTTGLPTAFAIGTADWSAIANAHARALWAMGLRPGDLVCIAAIFSLYMGSWGALAGVERLGATAFPFGAGAAGMTARCAHWLARLKPRGFYATPTYALYLAEAAAGEGLDPRDFGIGKMFFSGEPGASIPAVRERLAQLYGAEIYDCGSMAEMTPWMHLAGTGGQGMLAWQDIAYTEVCDPKTMRRVPYGARGTPVYTHLERTSQPMIRLLSGDLALWTDDPSPCGRSYPSLPNGIFGRIDDMFTVRGENVYPSEIDAVLTNLPGYGGEHRIVITRSGPMDELLLRVEADADVDARGEEARRRLAESVRHAVRLLLGLGAAVEILAPGSIPRTDFKARRVVDDRELYRNLNAALDKGTGP
ncbi:MAG: AMP-binding protein [Alphaproteobacteria bacterium]|nr:AMP-binding protein [Alphaproteobacteria bacterium]